MMAINNRLQKDIKDLKEANLDYFVQMQSEEEGNMHIWTGLLLPSNPPYHNSAFRIRIHFPAEYPFKPPVITIVTPIYHPNIDEKGVPCLPIISPENWKPCLRLEQVIHALAALINTPELEHPVRPDVANLWSQSAKRFNKVAEDYCKKYAEKRPSIPTK